MAVYICQACGSELTSWEGKCPSCGQTESIKLNQSDDKMIDRVIKGKFRLTRKLGQGGMGAVYLAEQLGIGAKVAIKFLKSEFSNDVEIARRFMNEAKSYAKVAHPNAVVFHDFGQDEEGNLFIAMEYCEGRDLKKVISERGRLPASETIDIILQVADVLSNAHQKGVIHRDLKPENIMLREGLRGVHVKVLDFGIARLMGEGTRLTVQGQIAGTPRYMSPEQVEGRDVDLRADIYALGIVTFETLTGVQPFDGTTITEIMHRQVSDPMPSLKSIAPELDYAGIDAVIQRACAKRPDDRWPDLAAFAMALSQAAPTQVQRAPQQPGHTTQVHAGVGKPAAPGVHTAAPTLNAIAGSANETSVEFRQKSKTLWVSMGAAVTLAVAGGGLWMSRREPEVVPLPARVDTVTTIKTAEPPTLPAVAKDQEQLDIRRGVDSMARGKSAWERGDIEEAYTHFKFVPVGTPDKAEAEEFQKKVDDIRTKLKAGNAAFSNGDCSKASAQFQAVVKMNAKVREALDGLSKCKVGSIPTRFE